MSIINFTPLSGAHNEDALCYLLEIDDYKIMLDCGWAEPFKEEAIAPLKNYCQHVDAVLLSHPDLLHLGALPYAVSKYGLDCKIYGTTPVYQMGQMFLYDAHQSRHKEEDFGLFTLDDIDTAFSRGRFVDLKYQQIVELEGGITIQAHQAGHMIGGTVWKIKKDTEEIIYAVDYYHSRERHLNPSVLESLNRPSMLSRYVAQNYGKFLSVLLPVGSNSTWYLLSSALLLR